MKFHVQSLRNMSRPIDLPAAADDWRIFSQKVLAQHRVEFLLDRITEEDQKLGFSLPNRFGKRVTAPVHCECALALQLSASDSPAVGYIGVSKLSCLACWHFLEGLQCAGHEFYTRGSHPTAHFPWKYPDLEIRQAGLSKEQSAKIFKSFRDGLSETYVWRLQERERLHMVSAARQYTRSFNFSMDVLDSE